MYSKLISLILVMIPLPILATPCEQANQLVIQAYQLGNHSAVYAKKQQLLRQAVRLCPNHSDAHNNLGVLLEQQQNYSKALYHYQRAIANDSDYTEAWIGMGDIYYQQNQFPLSLEAYLHACTSDQQARQRVAELFYQHRYRTAEKGQVLTKESLSLLYDKQRLQQLHEMANDCRRRFRSLTISTATLLTPYVIYRNIHFHVGEYRLTATAESQLNQIANTLQSNNAQTIQISGHTDTQPFAGYSRNDSDQLNWKLSQDRANAVATALTQRGIPITKITTMGYGYNRPIAHGSGEAAWAKNRRVEIEVD